MLAVSSFCSLLYPLLTILSRAVFENKHVKRNFLVPENKLWYPIKEDTAVKQAGALSGLGGCFQKPLPREGVM